MMNPMLFGTAPDGRRLRGIEDRPDRGPAGPSSGAPREPLSRRGGRSASAPSSIRRPRIRGAREQARQRTPRAGSSWTGRSRPSGRWRRSRRCSRAPSAASWPRRAVTRAGRGSRAAGVHGPRGAAAGRPGPRGRAPGRDGARGRPGGPHAAAERLAAALRTLAAAEQHAGEDVDAGRGASAGPHRGAPGARDRAEHGPRARRRRGGPGAPPARPDDEARAEYRPAFAPAQRAALARLDALLLQVGRGERRARRCSTGPLGVPRRPGTDGPAGRWLRPALLERGRVPPAGAWRERRRRDVAVHG